MNGEKDRTLSWTDLRGKTQTRKTNSVVHLPEYEGTPGHALLLIAANRHLSLADLSRLIGAYGVKRSRSWVSRRRWLFSDPGTVYQRGNSDGQDSRAIAVMRENPTVSLRQLSKLLAEHRITRGKDWVMKHRCD